MIILLKTDKKPNKILILLIFWTSLFGIYFFNYRYGSGYTKESPVPQVLSLVLLNLWDIPIALIYFHLWLPYIVKLKKQYPLWGVIAIACLGLLSLALVDGFLFAETGKLLKYNLKFPLGPEYLEWERNFPEAIISIVLYAVVMEAQRLAQEKDTLELLQDNMRVNYDNLLLQHEVEEKEMEQLRSQIDRHTLLNMMDSIYFSENLETAQEMSLKVKNLMVYALQNSFTKKVSLDTEITFLKDYIDLKLLEFVHKPVKIDFQVNTATNHIQIPPFILFVFVENVFKHGIHKLSKNRWATISIELKENQLHFQTRNPKPIHPIGDTPNTSGHGIRLTRKRLATFYPQAHWLDENTQKEEEHLFEINLIIHLTQ